MMIWFAGILQNTCCNKTKWMKIKQTKKKKLGCEFGVFYLITRIDYRVIS